MKKMNKKICIIGGGPAGIATAFQLKRSDFDPIIFEKGNVGGLVVNANLIENYPGFLNGISGIDFVEILKKTVEKYKLDIRYENVINVNYKNKIFKVETNKKKYEFNILIVASGTIPEHLMALEKKYPEEIFYNVQELFKYKSKKIAIIGSGDVAFDYALNLSKKNEIYILNRGTDTKCLPLLFERVMKNKKIHYFKNAEISVNSKKFIEIENNGNRQGLDIDFILCAIGRKQNLGFLKNISKEKRQEFMKNQRLFFVGDVKNDIFRQLSIAVGDGIKTAMFIRKLYGDKE
jgi:thioredoxin reductase